MDSFRFNGVFLMETRPGVEKVSQPGVFYLPSVDAIPDDMKSRAKDDQITLDDTMPRARHSGFSSLSDEEKKKLAVLLFRYQHPRFHTNDPLHFYALDKTEVGNPELTKWINWMERLARKSPQIQLLRSGEMSDENPAILCKTWVPPPPPRCEKLDPDVERMGMEIQALVDKRRDSPETFPDVEWERSTDLLSGFAHPVLRTLLSDWDLAKRAVETQLGQMDSDQRKFEVLDEERKEALDAFMDGLSSFPIIIQKPLPFTFEGPSTLYWRGPWESDSAPNTKFRGDEVKLAEIFRCSDKNQEPHFMKLAEILTDYQYPRLKSLYVAFQDYQGSDFEEERTALEGKWNQLFMMWVRSMEHASNISIKLASRTDPEGDPAILYHRAPLRTLGLSDALESCSFLREGDFNSLMALLNDSQTSDSPLKLARIVKEFLPTRLKQQLEIILNSSESASKKLEKWKRSDFEEWVTRIRYQAKSPTEKSTSVSSSTKQRLAEKYQLQENQINAMLKKWVQLPSEDQAWVEQAILPFWQRQHSELQEGWRRFWAERDGLTDEEIETGT